MFLQNNFQFAADVYTYAAPNRFESLQPADRLDRNKECETNCGIEKV